MRQGVQEFVSSLLDHARTSTELEVMLNYNHEASNEVWFPGDRQTLERLKLAIKYKQKGVSIGILNNNFLEYLSVCSSSKCSTTSSSYLVWRLAWFPEKIRNATNQGCIEVSMYVPSLQYELHNGARIRYGQVHEETIREIYFPFS